MKKKTNIRLKLRQSLPTLEEEIQAVKLQEKVDSVRGCQNLEILVGRHNASNKGWLAEIWSATKGDNSC